MLEFQRGHLSELNLVQEPPKQQSFINFEAFELAEGKIISVYRLYLGPLCHYCFI